MTAIKTLAHVCIKSVDLAKTTDFYCGALGMEKLFQFTRQGAVIGFYLRASPGTFIEVFYEKQLPPAQDALTLHHFCLESDDLESLRKTLLERGHAPTEIKLGADHSYQFWIKDPSGVALEFHQYTENSAQRIGQDVEVNW